MKSRGRNPKPFTEQDMKMFQEYMETDKGMAEVAEKYGVTRECFRYRFKKYLTGLEKKEQKKQDIQNAANTGFFL